VYGHDERREELGAETRNLLGASKMPQASSMQRGAVMNAADLERRR
jgi:hypothetical protein